MFSDTFAGIDPSSVPGFVGAQVVGGAVGLGMIRFLYPDVAAIAGSVLAPQDSDVGSAVLVPLKGSP